MKEYLKVVIEDLFKFNRCLLGEGYHNALKYLGQLIKLDIIVFKSGERFGTWTVPDEWVVRDAWVKDPQGNKIADYKVNPLSLVVGSLPYQGSVMLDILRNHWHYSDDMPDATPYIFKYYKKDWGFCFPKNQLFEPRQEDDVKLRDKLVNGSYEVFIDTEFKSGLLELGVHTIPGKSDREILLFAHLDHPYQANDNLSGVACLLNLTEKLKCEHTIKIVFCPETIGSIAYAVYKNTSKADFMIAVDICGNEGSVLLQKSFDSEHKINRVAHLAIHSFSETYRKGAFRNTIGSDEYAFNDPKIGVPGILLSTHPYKEYHTDQDTPEKISYEQIEKMGNIIQKIIEIWEKDYVPERILKGPLQRSRYNLQTDSPQVNLSFDYFFYNIDGKKTLAELCSDFGLNFDFVYDALEEMIEDKIIRRK